jgi:hypothetical protein
MAFTAAEVSNIAAGALDWYFGRPKVYAQTIQNKPLLAHMEKTAKSFPGGKGDISIAVQGAYGDGSGNDVLTGYTHDDTVTFYNEANVQRANFPWREHHLGIEMTYTEFKVDGISINDTAMNKGESTHSEADRTRLFSLMANKMEGFAELHARQMNALLWGDGTGDAKALAGIQSILSADPSVGVVGGINRATAGNEFWRNRARTAAFGTKVGATPALAAHGGGAVTSSAANGGALLAELEKEYRQLIKYGGKPTVFLAGSDFIDAMQLEMRANGQYSQTGFTGSNDGSFGDTRWKGLNVQYDPTLDDLSLAKRAYLFDPKDIFLMKMDGEWRRSHTAARPADQFVLKRSMTSTGQVITKRCNSALVIDIA